MGRADTQGVGSYLCMPTSPAPVCQRIVECFGLEQTLNPILSQPRVPPLDEHNGVLFNMNTTLGGTPWGLL